MSLPCSPAYWQMGRTSVRNEWRAHQKESALTRSAGCAPSTPALRPTVPRKHASRTHTPAIRILSFGAMAQRHHPMASSSARAIEPQSAAISICIRAANLDRNSTAICQISTATSAFCPSVRPKASRPMCSMGCPCIPVAAMSASAEGSENACHGERALRTETPISFSAGTRSGCRRSSIAGVAASLRVTARS